jgi:predicted outer membrane lipoprotein
MTLTEIAATLIAVIGVLTALWLHVDTEVRRGRR